MAVTRSQNREAALAVAVTRSQKRKATALREPVTSIKALAYLSNKRKTSTAPSKPLSLSAFGKLPAELRNHIYTLSLEDVPHVVNLRYFEQPAVARARRQLRNEYLPMLCSRLGDTAWEAVLPYCIGKQEAQTCGLTHQMDFWARATLPWLRNRYNLSTTRPVTFVACYLRADHPYGTAKGTMTITALSHQHKQHADASGQYDPAHFHTSVRGAKAMNFIEDSSEMKQVKEAVTVRLIDVQKVVERFGQHFWNASPPHHRRHKLHMFQGMWNDRYPYATETEQEQMRDEDWHFWEAYERADSERREREAWAR
ncbi:hypothetical protein LTR85_005511 [Meristemomyces frigidus]|nr:hypothetical protein LTR85_005511 [Meristemomyces frigidus]